jgi:S1-C subfamily serine protease
MNKLKQTISILILLLSTTLFAKNITVTPNAVVKVFSTISLPDYQYPWQTNKISKSTGSGAVISGNRILTSAHVVTNARLIEIKKENDPKKYIATVKYISHQADLAVLELKDKSFFNGVDLFKLDGNVKARDEVTVLGYPLGGDTISTTTGVVSRIEYVSYAWSSEYLLAIQIDAAINSGNSGGPVVNDENELVGIAMMTLSGSSNIGYIVPAAVIKTFLKDIEDDTVDGFHVDSISIQNIDNDAQKAFYGLNGRTGVLITYVGIDEKILKVDDIVLAVDGKAIANNNTIETQYGHINFNIAFHKKQIGQTVKLKILRDKKEMTVKYRLNRVKPLIYEEFGKEPRYIVYGGFAFTPLTKNYLSAISKGKKNIFDMLFYEKNKREKYQEGVVSLETVFPSKANRGYSIASYVLIKVNGTKIKNFQHLVEILDGMEEEFTEFEFLEKTKVVVSTKEAKEDLARIMELDNLKSDRRVE